MRNKEGVFLQLEEKIIENYIEIPRIGAFEIQLVKAEKGKNGLELFKKVLFSKLNKKTWPFLSSVLKDISKHHH
jgi:hypothetical protein